MCVKAVATIHKSMTSIHKSMTSEFFIGLALVFALHTMSPLITSGLILSGCVIFLIHHEHITFKLRRDPFWIGSLFFHQAWYSQWLFNRDPNNIRYLSPQYITPEMSSQIGYQYPRSTQYVPNFDLTSWLIKNPKLLRLYRDRCQSKPELIVKILKQDIQQFKYVPFKAITQEMVDLAISQDLRLFKHVPQAFVTQDMVDQALQHHPRYFKHIPIRFMTQVMVDHMMQVDPSCYRHVPKLYRTEAMHDQVFQYYRESMLKNINGFCLVPHEFHTHDFLRRFIDSCNIQQVLLRKRINPHHFTGIKMTGLTFNQLFGACKLRGQMDNAYRRDRCGRVITAPKKATVCITHRYGYFFIKIKVISTSSS